MFFRKYFAKAALKGNKISSGMNVKGLAIISAALLPIAGGLTGGLLESDPGNEYEEQIYQQYDQALTLLEQARQEYDAKYNPAPSEEEKRIADISISIAEFIEEAFSFYDADDLDENNAEESFDAATEDWQQIVFLSGIFAEDLQQDSKLSEADAGKLAQRLENNVISFWDLGYPGKPDADDLRECQSMFSDSNQINNCTLYSEYADGTDIAKGAGIGLLLSLLLLPGVPLALRHGGNKHRDRLTRWANGKKGVPPSRH